MNLFMSLLMSPMSVCWKSLLISHPYSCQHMSKGPVNLFISASMSLLCLCALSSNNLRKLTSRYWCNLAVVLLLGKSLFPSFSSFLSVGTSNVLWTSLISSFMSVQNPSKKTSSIKLQRCLRKYLIWTPYIYIFFKVKIHLAPMILIVNFLIFMI